MLASTRAVREQIASAESLLPWKHVRV